MHKAKMMAGVMSALASVVGKAEKETSVVFGEPIAAGEAGPNKRVQRWLNAYYKPNMTEGEMNAVMPRHIARELSPQPLSSVTVDKSTMVQVRALQAGFRPHQSDRETQRRQKQLDKKAKG